MVIRKTHYLLKVTEKLQNMKKGIAFLGKMCYDCYHRGDDLESDPHVTTMFVNCKEEKFE